MKTRSTLPEDNLSGFAPIADSDCRILILGSMPGKKSLQDAEYYAHPRNAFWKIIDNLFAINSDAPYKQRCAGLLASQVALWDVLKNCRREGSLDSKIELDSEVANDLMEFFEQHPSISDIYFNGTKAETAFRQHVKNQFRKKYPQINLDRLPSTSPAHASMTFSEKLEKWAVIKEVIRD